MKVGAIHSSVSLDRNPPIYYGPMDPVTGKVQLEFTPFCEKGVPVTDELFAPLQLSIVLEGHVQIGIHDHNHYHSVAFKDGRTMFRSSKVIHSGSFRAPTSGKSNFPFSIPFPKSAVFRPEQENQAYMDHDGKWKLHIHDMSREEDLPPFFHVRFRDGLFNCDAKIEYRVKTEVEIQGVDVSVSPKGPKPELKYYPSSKSKDNEKGDNMFEEVLTIANKVLLPEDQRPQGLLGKTKAILNNDETPRYAFRVLCSSLPNRVRPGRGLTFEVAVRAESKRTTTSIQPELVLSDCKVALIGYTRIYAVQGDRVSEEVREVAKVATVPGSVHPEGPFSKAHDHVKQISIPPLPNVPSTFAIKRVSRKYGLRIDLEFRIEKSKAFVRKEFPVVVDGSEGPDIPVQVQAGPSSRAHAEDEEMLPAYEEAGSSTVQYPSV